MTSTIVADDPLFGLLAYGGAVTTTGGQIAVVQRAEIPMGQGPTRVDMTRR
jgi:hypothetical protein